MIATPTTGLVIDAMRNMLAGVIGCFESRSMTPCDDSNATLPLRATTVTAPAISPAAIRRAIIWLMRCSRSDDNPTSSGFTPGDDAVDTVATDSPSAARNRANEIAVFMIGSPSSG